MPKNIEKVKKLREENWGYRRIARELRLTRDAVRYISKGLNLIGYRGGYPVKKVKPVEIEAPRQCLFCGKILEKPPKGRHGPKPKYCSEKCRRAQDLKEKNRRRREIRPFIKICAGCGNTFRTHRRDISFCSTRCATNQRQRGAGGRFISHKIIEKPPLVKVTKPTSHRQREIQAREFRVSTKKRLDAGDRDYGI